MAENETTKWLYDKLTSMGYNVGKTQDVFDNLMKTNEQSRRWAFDKARERGLDVGEYDEFVQHVNPTEQSAPQASALPKVGETPTLNSTTDPVSRMKELVAQNRVNESKQLTLQDRVDKANEEDRRREEKPKPRTDSYADMMPSEQRNMAPQQMEPVRMDVARMQEDTAVDSLYTPKPVRTADDIMDNYRNRFAMTQRGQQLAVELSAKEREVSDKYLRQFEATPEYKEIAGRKYRTQQEADEANKLLNDTFQQMYGKQIAQEMMPYHKAMQEEVTARYGNRIGEEMKALSRKDTSQQVKQLAGEVDSLLKKKEGDLRRRAGSSGNAMNALMGSTQYNVATAADRREQGALRTAKKLLEQSQNIIDEAGRQGQTNFVAGLGRGVRDNFNLEDFTFGLAEMADAKYLNNALKKASAGEQLTAAEEKLLDASVVNMATQAYFSENLGRGYKAGGMTAESLPFMLEFIINPISASGNAIAKGLLKYGLKRFGNVATRKGAKFAAQLMGDAAAALGMEATTGLPRVEAGTLQRLNEDYEYSFDDNGNLQVQKVGDTSLAGALGRSAASTFFENQSEMVFNAFKVFSPLMKAAGDAMPGGVNELMARLRNSKPGRLYRELKNNPTFREAARRAQFHGIFEEDLEEVYNNLANVAIGEMTMDEAMDLDNNIDTFLGLAPTSVMFGMIGLGGMARERYRNRKAMDRLAAQMDEQTRARMDELRRMSRERGNEDIRQFIKTTMADAGLTPEEKASEIAYAYEVAKRNAIDDIQEAETQDNIDSETQDIVSHSDPSTGMYTEMARITYDEKGNRVTVPGYKVGEMAGAPLWVPEGAERTPANTVWLKPGEWDEESVQSMPTDEVVEATASMMREDADRQAGHEDRYSPDIKPPFVGSTWQSGNNVYTIVQPNPDGGWVVQVETADGDGKPAITASVVTDQQYYDMMQAGIDEASQDGGGVRTPDEEAVDASSVQPSAAPSEEAAAPLREDGTADYDRLLQEDPMRFYRAFAGEFGTDEANAALAAQRDKYYSDAQKTRKKAGKEASPGLRAELLREAKRQEEEGKKYDKLIAGWKKKAAKKAPETKKEDAATGASGRGVQSSDRGIQVRLSDEVDENGRQFVLSKDGKIEFGEIGENSGLQPAPILLSEGMITNPSTNDGYGLVHIEARHGNQIRKAGYASVVDFIENVAKHYDIIKEGNIRDGRQTYRLQLTDKHNNTLMVELSGDGTYWNINTAGIFKSSYGANNREIYNRHTTVKQPTEAAEASRTDEQGGNQSAPSMNAPISTDKGSVIPAEKQAPGTEKPYNSDKNTRQRIEDARAEVDTEPTEGQKEAGNYRKGHVRVDGYDISIENPKGSVRSGVDAGGQAWSVTMNNDYGYIRGTKAVDGDHIDIFLSDNPDDGSVFVIDQLDEKGAFDESKVMYGFRSAEEAKAAYLSNYSAGWADRVMAVTEVSKEEFKKWIESSVRKTKPFSEYKSVKASGVKASGAFSEEEIEGLVSGFKQEATDRYREKKNELDSNRDDFISSLSSASEERLSELYDSASNVTSIDEAASEFERALRSGEIKDEEDLQMTDGMIDNLTSFLSMKDYLSSIKNELDSRKKAAQKQNVTPKNPSGNRLVTDERYAELRERMRRKLGGQMNMGTDPEIFEIGIEMAIYHIEKGARKFMDYANRMIEDMGDSIRPYLKAFYNGAHDLPEMAEFANEMTPSDEVARTDVSKIGRPDATLMDMAGQIAREQEVKAQAETAKKAIEKKRKSSKKTSVPIGDLFAEDKNEVANDNQKGVFGTIYTQFKGKAKEAIEWLKNKKEGEASGALHHHSIGDISLVWGDEKTGLAKIIKKHPEVVDDLQNIIDGMEVVQESDNRIKLESDTHFAVVSKEFKGEPREKWLLTAYEKKETPEPANSRMDVESNLKGKSDDTATRQNPDVSADKGSKSAPKKQADGPKNAEEDVSLQGRTSAMMDFADEVKRRMLDALESGEKPFRSIADLRRLAREQGMEVSDEGRTDIMIQELVEDGLARAARKLADDARRKAVFSRAKSFFPVELFDKICRLYDMQPTISQRSSNRIRMQQYSTPLPMSFVADMFVHEKGKITVNEMILEPTAGNGMLVFAVPAAKLHVNELDDVRYENLRFGGYGEVTKQDATQPFEGGRKYAGVISNPPFGSAEAKLYDGTEIGGLEHQIALNALDSMKDDGRAAIIVGGNMEYGANGAIKGADRAFYSYLYDHYNVKGVVDMDGAMYRKQGTSYPTRMILIEGRRSDEERAQESVYPPVRDKAIPKAQSFEELYDIVNGLLNSKEKTNGTAVLRREQGLGPDPESGSGNRNDRPNHQQPPKDDRERGGGERRGNQLQGGQEQSRPSVLGERGRDSGTSGTGRGTGETGRRDERDAGGRVLAQDDKRVGDGTSGQRGVGLAPNGAATSDKLRATSNSATSDELQATSEERRAEGGKRSLTDEKTAYRPHSLAFSLESVAPAAMTDAMDEALRRIEAEVGDIDTFVQTELGYDSVEALHNALAAEQVDSVAMAIYQMSRGEAMIIGDQTGVGKGRQMAALIRWAVNKGKKPIFITQKSDLFSDLYRDLVDIGSGNLRPFIFNSDGTVKDAKNEPVHRPLSDAKMKEVLRGDRLPDGYDFVVLTYSQLNKGDSQSRMEADEQARKSGKRVQKRSKEGNASSPKPEFLRKLAKDNILLLDESHTAAGDGNTGMYLQSIMRSAEAATFASATFAKRPDTMPLYALRTAMSKANVEAGKLIEIIEKGGVTLQEIMSRALSAVGQMVRRERDMSDVKTDWKTVDEPSIVERARTNYDRTVKAFNAIIKFQKEYVDPYIEELSKTLAATQGSARKTRGTENMGLQNVPFASKAYNYTKQLLLALKVDAIVDEVEREIKAGRHPVIALESTMESVLEGYNAGDVLNNATFGASLMKGLESTLSYTVKDEKNKEQKHQIPLGMLPQSAQSAYKEVQKLILDSTRDVFVSPIDDIISKLNQRGYSVGELTGRDKYVSMEDGRAVVRKRADKDKKRMTMEFNAGKIDVLILNKSASTGISLHASSRFSDQRQRTMVMAQPLSDINDYMQMIGRIDRTGQVHRGYYINLGLPVPAENRFMMMLSTKLKSLNANTTTSQDSKQNDVEAPDLLNKYGSQVVVEYLRDHPDVYEKMGSPLKLNEGQTLEEYTPQEDDARKVTGYVALLSVEEQEAFYNEVTERYNTLITYLNETDSNDLRISVMPLRAKTLSKKVATQGNDPNGMNPFAQDSYIERVEMNVLRKPYMIAEVKKLIENLSGKSGNPGKRIVELIRRLKDETDRRIEEENARYQKALSNVEQDLERKAAKINAQKKLDDNQKEAAIRDERDTLQKKAEEMHEKNLRTISSNSEKIEQALLHIRPGTTYLIPDVLGGLPFSCSTPGIFCGFRAKDNGLTPSTVFAVFAVLDGRRKVEVKLSDTKSIQQIRQHTMQNYDAAIRVTADNWNSQIPKTKRTEGYMLTGNIIQAVADSQGREGGFAGKLVSYTDMEGNIHDGILMPQSWNPSLMKSAGVPINARLNQLNEQRQLESTDGNVLVEKERWGDGYTLTVPRTKKQGGSYFGNEELLDLVVGRNFNPYRGKLRADIRVENIQAVLDVLSRLGVRVNDKTEGTDDVLYRNSDDIEEVNRKFNEELDIHINGTLKNGHIYQLGLPSAILKSTGIPDLPIQMSATRLEEKASRYGHDFSLGEVKNLVKALQEPVAVFAYGNKDKAQNIIVEIQKDGKNFVVGLSIRHTVNGRVLDINSIRNVFPKNNAEWLNWISQGKSLYLNKEKIQTLIDQQRTNLADVDYLDLDSIAKVVENFENPKLPGENLRDGGGSYTDDELAYANDPVAKLTGRQRHSAAQRKAFARSERKRMAKRVDELSARMNLDNVEVVTDAGTLEGMKSRAKGFFDPRTGRITVVIPNHASVKDAEQTLLHEAVAHYGLRKLFGTHFDTFLDNVYRNAELPIRRRIADMATRNGWDVRKATEEYLAALAEDTEFDNVNAGWWDCIKRLFIDMLHRIGFEGFNGVTLSDNELRYILWRSYENLRAPGSRRSILGMAEDIERQDRLRVGEYSENSGYVRAAAEEVLLRSAAEEAASAFASRFKGAGRAVVARGGDVRYSLTDEGLNEEEINDLNGLRQEGCLAAYNPRTGTVIILNENATTDEINSYLWHENAHRALGNVFGVRKTKTVEPISEWLSSKYPKLRQMVDSEYAGKPADEIKEEMVVYHLNYLFDKYGADGIMEAIDHLPDAVRDVYVQLINYIFYGKGTTERDGLRGVPGEEAGRPEGERADAGAGPALLAMRNPVPAIQEEDARRRYDERLNSESFQAREAFQDKMLALKELQKVVEEASGDKIKSYENAYLAENQMSSKSGREKEVYGKKFFQPMMEAVAGLVKKGATYQEIHDYLIAKHGLERNEVFAMRDAEREADEWYREKKGELDSLHDSGKLSDSAYQKKLDNLDDKRDKRIQSNYIGNREKDYSGLIALTGESDAYEQAAREIVADFEGRFDVADLWDKINSATKETLRKSYESGVISKELYEKVRAQFQYYVPLRGWEEETASDVYEYINSRTSSFNPTLKKAGGRTSLADDPLANIGNMAESAIHQGNRNLMKQAFMNMAINHPTQLTTVSKMWFVLNKSTGKWEPSYPQFDGNETDAEKAEKIAEHTRRMKELQKNGEATTKRGRLNINYNFDGKGQAEEHSVHVRRNGEDYVIYINGNPRAAQAINGLTNPDNNTWFRRLNRQLAANFTTRNPAFVMTNLSRDLIYSFYTLKTKEGIKYAYKFRNNIPTAMAVIMRGLRGETGTSVEYKYFQEFLDNGGETGYANLRDVEDYKKLIKKEVNNLSGKIDYFKLIRAFAHNLELFNRWAEDVSRFNAYMTSRKMGKSITESINDAKEVTVNFNRKGAGYKGNGIYGKASGLLGDLFLFFNASVQSLDNFGSLPKKNLKGFLTLLGGFTTAGFLMPVINELLISLTGGDDDYYGNLSEWTRRNNLCIYVGDGRFITVPLPIELRAFYGIGDIAYHLISGKDERYANDIAYDMANQLTDLLPINPLGNDGDITMSFTPDALKPIIQAYYKNKDFTGRAIYKENTYNISQPEWTKVYKGTSKALVELSEFTNSLGGGDKYKRSQIEMLNWNPAKIEHLLESYFGGMATTIIQSAKTLYGLEEAIFKNDTDDLQMRDIPVANRFVKDASDERNSYSVTNRKYFKWLKDYQDIDKNVRGYLKEIENGDESYRNRLDKLMRSDEYRAYEVFKESKKDIDKISKLEKSIPENDERTRKELNKQIAEMKHRIVEKIENR